MCAQPAGLPVSISHDQPAVPAACSCRKTCGIALLIFGSLAAVGAAYIFAAGSSLSHLTILGYSISVPTPAIYGTAAGLAALALSCIYGGLKNVNRGRLKESPSSAVEGAGAHPSSVSEQTLTGKKLTPDALGALGEQNGAARAAGWVDGASNPSSHAPSPPPEDKSELIKELRGRVTLFQKEGEASYQEAKTNSKALKPSECLPAIEFYLTLAEHHLTETGSGEESKTAGELAEILAKANEMISYAEIHVTSMSDDAQRQCRRKLFGLQLRLLKLQAQAEPSKAKENVEKFKRDSLVNIVEIPEYVEKTLQFSQVLRDISTLGDVNVDELAALEKETYKEIEQRLKVERFIALYMGKDQQTLDDFYDNVPATPMIQGLCCYIDDLLKRKETDQAHGLCSMMVILAQHGKASPVTFHTVLAIIRTYDNVKMASDKEHVDTIDTEIMKMLQDEKHKIECDLMYKSKKIIEKFPDTLATPEQQIQEWSSIIDAYVIPLAQIEESWDSVTFARYLLGDYVSRKPFLQFFIDCIQQRGHIHNPCVMAQVMLKLAKAEASLTMVKGKEKTADVSASNVEQERIRQACEALFITLRENNLDDKASDIDQQRLSRAQELLSLADERARSSAESSELLTILVQARQFVDKTQESVLRVKGLLALVESYAGLLNGMETANKLLEEAYQQIKSIKPASSRETCVLALAQMQSMVIVDASKRDAAIRKTLTLRSPNSDKIEQLKGNRKFIVGSFQDRIKHHVEGRVVALIKVAKNMPQGEQQEEKIKRTLGIAERVALDISHPAVQLEAFIDIACTYLEHGLDQEAMVVIHEMEQQKKSVSFRTSYAYMRLIKKIKELDN